MIAGEGLVGILLALLAVFGLDKVIDISGYLNLPEGVSYSIIIMNILVPHIETLTKPLPFGAEKEKKSKKEEAAS